MKYGLLEFSPLRYRTDSYSINVGDMIQSRAIYNIYRKMGINDDQIKIIDINDINNNEPKKVNDYNNGEYILLPININLSTDCGNGSLNIFPLPDHIIPIFIGLSLFATDNLSDDLIQYLRRYSPIGCRDENTLNLMRSNGIESYLAGCVTATLPRRKKIDGGGCDKIYLVDVPDIYYEKIRDRFGYDIELVKLSHIYQSDQIIDLSTSEKIVDDYLEQYINNAGLVISSRLHCLSPCMALGIPVLALLENVSPRYGWIDKFIKLYTPDVPVSEWYPTIADYEDVKNKMVDVIINRINETFEKYQNIYDLSYFFENRIKSDYGIYYKTKLLNELPFGNDDEFDYIIWGTGQIGLGAYNVIKDMYPNANLIAAVDSFSNGNFCGHKIEKPDIILDKDYNSAYIFVASYSGEKDIANRLVKMNKIETRDFLSFATKNG